MAADMEMLKDYLEDKLVKARTALTALEPYTQEQVDALVKACAKAVFDHAEELAGDAVEETRMGVYEDKVAKNRSKARVIWWSLKGKKSVGIIDVDEASGITKVAKPVGVVGAITPTTNPIVTCMSNSMFALKCRNPIIIAPHPRAMGCCIKTVEYMNANLKALGAPDHCIQILDIKSLDLTKMLAASVDVIIATGGMDMVRSVYSSGKPALGVGAGNVQVLVDQGYDLETAIPQIITGRGFDNGIICTGEQAIHLYRGDYDRALEVINRSGAYVVPREKTGIVRDFLFPNGVMNRDMVGQDAVLIAEKCGISVPDRTRVLAVQADGIDDTLGMEKMFPVITLYAYDTWEEAVEQAKNNLNKIGKGHSIAVHSTNRKKIEYAALKTEVSRIVCNQTCATGGGGSFQNGLNPTNTLGCGSWGNNSISENLTYYHLMNISRIAQYMPDHATPSYEEICD